MIKLKSYKIYENDVYFINNLKTKEFKLAEEKLLRGYEYINNEEDTGYFRKKELKLEKNEVKKFFCIIFYLFVIILILYEIRSCKLV